MQAKRKYHRQRKRLRSEVLEPRHLLTSNVLISEFVATNDSTLEDFEGDSSDWIELFNNSDEAVDLNGWHLTDNAEDLGKWKLPAKTIGPGEYIVVFASGKDIAEPGSELHTNFKLSAGGEYLALVEADGSTVANEFSPTFPAQFTDVSYGIGSDGNHRFFNMVTPGAANADATEAPSGEVTYSVTGRLFADSFDLVITPPVANAEIRYSLDGSIPDENSVLYDGPLRVADSMRIRARAFEPGKSAGPINSQGYIEIGNDLKDFEGGVFESNLPLMVFHSFGGRVDSNDTRLVPVSSVFINNDGGTASLLDEPEFAGRAGLRTRGQSSQGWPKKQYALELWEEGNSDTQPILSRSGDDRAVSIFGLPAESDWVLNGPYADKTQLNNFLTFNWSREMGQYAPRTKQVEVFVKTGSGSLDMRRDYRGTYVLLEKIKIDSERVDIAQLSPSATEEPEISGGYIWKFDKNGTGDVNFTSSFQSRTGSGRPWKFVEPQRPPTVQREWLKSYLTEFETALYGRNFADPDVGYAKYIDIDSWIDTWLLVEFTKNIDGFRLSTYYHKDVGGKITQGPTWDFNLSLANANYLRGAFPDGWYSDDISSRDYPYWDRLFADPNFELRVRDRWFELRETMFSTENLLGAIDEGVGQLSNGNPNLAVIAPGERSNPISRNFNRWGTLDSYLWPNCFFGSGTCPTSPLPNQVRPNSYADYVFILRDFVQRRADWIDQQFKLPPAIAPQGAIVSDLVEVTLAPLSGGVVYYTLDGSDPRDPLSDGESASAIEYEGPFTVSENVVVQARSIRGGTWSGIASKPYYVEIPSIAISELNYNPADPSSAEEAAGFTDNDDFEFLELSNFGSKPVQLGGMRVTDGLNVVLNDAVLDPGNRAVVVRNRDAFQFRYGDSAQIVGEYGHKTDSELDEALRNSGERISLEGALGEPIEVVEFSDQWYPLSDGDGFSLARREPILAQSESDAAEWRTSGLIGGSPGLVESGQVPAPGDVVISEVVSELRGASRDVVELHNRTDEVVSIGGYFLSDVESQITKFRIPAGTQIPANGFLELDQAALGAELKINPNGGRLSLRGALVNQTLTGFHEFVEYGSIVPGSSWGRHETSIGSDFARMSAMTLGEENAAPEIGPIVINEIQYNPKPNGREFIELSNLSGETVSLSGWRFDRGIRYRFADDVTIPANGFAVLIQRESADETTGADLVAAFRTEQNVPDGVPVFVFDEDADGSLSNGGEALVLHRPTPDVAVNLEVDRIVYSDEAPWLSRADGFGPSLSRFAANEYGNDPANWKTSTQVGTPGRANVFEDATPPSVPHGLASSVLDDGSVGVAWTASVEPDSAVDHYVVYRNGASVGTSPIPFIRDSIVWQEGQGVLYSVSAVNVDGFESAASDALELRAGVSSFQQDDSYIGAADARIRESGPDANDSTGRRLIIDGNANGGTTTSASSVLMRWSDLSVPEDTQIVGVAVELYITNTGDDFQLKPINVEWNASEVTWNQAAEGRAWQVPGMLGATETDEALGVLKTPVRGVIGVDLGGGGKQLVQKWIDQPAENHGIAFVDPGGSTDSVALDSSDATTVEQRPRLVVFHVPSRNAAKGDLNFDGVADANDIDAIHAAIREGITDSVFDLNLDGLVNDSDSEYLLQEVMGTVRGDADLDGRVTFSDFLMLATSFASGNKQGWSNGDFDGDGRISNVDFTLLAANFGRKLE